MEESEKVKRAQRPWLYKTATSENEKCEKLLALPGIEQQAVVDNDKGEPRDLVTWKHKAMNSALFHPDDAPLTEKEKLELAAKKPREVLYENTRFKVTTTIGVNRPTTNVSVLGNRVEGRIGVDGREVTRNTPGSKGYKYVATPSPAPGAMGESPFMTWGEIEGTPVLVDPSATPISAPSFKIPDIPEREQLGISLAEKIMKHKREKKQTALKTATDSVRRYASPSQRIATMSPAAQRLISGQRLYTPSPLSSLGKSPRTPSVLTPSSVRLRDKGTPTPSRSISTAKKTAADFF